MLRPLLAASLVLGTASCVSRIPRYSEPVRLEAVALAEQESNPDLILLDVTWSVLPKDSEYLVIEIPRGGANASIPRLLSGAESYSGLRPRLLEEHQLECWSAERRREADLLLVSDVSESERRDYSVQCVRAGAGRFDLVITRLQHGAAESLGSLALPDEFTPAELATGWRMALVPPLLAIDIAWVPLTLAAIVVMIPFGSLGLVSDVFSDARW